MNRNTLCVTNFSIANSLRGIELPEDGDERVEGAAGGAEKDFSPPEVIEMFLVNGNTQDFFKPLGHT